MSHFPCPRVVGGCIVICYLPIGPGHKRRPLSSVESLRSRVVGLAICKDDRTSGYYLFGCDEDWNSITDTWHESLEEAKDQSEFDFGGVSSTWVTTKP